VQLYYHRRRSSVNFRGARYFCPKNNHEKINKMPEFYLITARIFFRILGGGAYAPCPFPPSPTPMWATRPVPPPIEPTVALKRTACNIEIVQTVNDAVSPERMTSLFQQLLIPRLLLSSMCLTLHDVISCPGALEGPHNLWGAHLPHISHCQPLSP